MKRMSVKSGSASRGRARPGPLPAKMRGKVGQPKAGPSQSGAPRPELLPARMRGGAAQAKAQPGGPGVPQPELLPVEMRGGAAQAKAGPSRSVAPWPELIPGGRGSSRGGVPRAVAQAWATGASNGGAGRSKTAATLQRSTETVESQDPSSFQKIAEEAAFADHTLQWLAGVLKTELPKAKESNDLAGTLARAVRHAYKYAVPKSYEGSKMPVAKLQKGEKAAEGYVYGTPNNQEAWNRNADSPTIRAMLQPNIEDKSDFATSMKAMWSFVHEQTGLLAKYKYLNGGAQMEIDPILIYIRVPEGLQGIYADFSVLDVWVRDHVVYSVVPFYYPFGSFHLSVNPLSSKFDSLSKALHEAVRIVASKTTEVTALAVAEAWYRLCLGKDL